MTIPITRWRVHWNPDFSGWRWVLSLDWCFIAIERQIRPAARHEKVFHAAGYYSLALSWRLGLGHEMSYYDGEHHSFSLGPLHLSWFR